MCPSTRSKIGLDRLACQYGSVSSTAHGIMPFCDFMAFSHSDIMMILGLVPNVITAYQLFCCTPGDTM